MRMVNTVWSVLLGIMLVVAALIALMLVFSPALIAVAFLIVAIAAWILYFVNRWLHNVE